MSGDTAELYRLARIACGRWRRDRDYDDLVQVAVTHGWATPYDYTSSSAMVYGMRMRCVDWLRVRDGDVRHVDKRCVTLNLDVRRVDGGDVPVSVIYRLSGREAIIAEMLSLGFTKDAIAGELGVHPSRVSQLLHSLRAAVSIDRSCA